MTKVTRVRLKEFAFVGSRHVNQVVEADVVEMTLCEHGVRIVHSAGVTILPLGNVLSLDVIEPVVWSEPPVIAEVKHEQTVKQNHKKK